MTITFARFLIDQGADPDALADDLPVLAAQFVAYAGGETPDALLDALIAQVSAADLGFTAERGTEAGVDVVYRGQDGAVLGCEMLAWDEAVDEDKAAALLAFADRHDALKAAILTRTREGVIAVAGNPVPLRPLALEALRISLRA